MKTGRLKCYMNLRRKGNIQQGCLFLSFNWATKLVTKITFIQNWLVSTKKTVSAGSSQFYRLNWNCTPDENHSSCMAACFFFFLVSTYVVCERLSVMHYTCQLPEFLVQNSLSAPTQVFQECWSEPPPPPPPKMQIWTDLGTLGWVGLDHHHHPPPNKMQIWTDLGSTTPPPHHAYLDRSWDFGLSWSITPPTPIPNPHYHHKNADLDRSWHFGLSSYVETNCCIPPWIPSHLYFVYLWNKYLNTSRQGS